MMNLKILNFFFTNKKYLYKELKANREKEKKNKFDEFGKVDENWQKVIKNKKIESKEKVGLILKETKKLEDTAKNRELITHVTSLNRTNIEEEINALYIDSIKAKIAILDNLNQTKN